MKLGREGERGRELGREKERERGRERRRVTDRDRRKERWSETDTAKTSVKQDRKDTSPNRRTPNGSSSRRWRSMDRREKPYGGQRVNIFGRDNDYADEDNWTKVVSKRSMKVMQKSSLAGRQSQNLEIGDSTKHYCLNWRNNADITSFYFTHFPDEANEELLWRHFKKWGDVREVYIAKRLNKDGRRYGFVRFKGVSDAKGLEVRLDNIFINDCKLFVNLPRFERPARNAELQKKSPIGRKYTNEASKPCGVTTGPHRRSYVDVMTKGGCKGDKRTNEALTPTILINPDEGGEYWCNETWVGKLKKKEGDGGGNLRGLHRLGVRI